MNLIIDIGNTSSKVGVYTEESEAKEVFRFDTLSEKEIAEVFGLYPHINACIVSCVGVCSPAVIQYLKSRCPRFILFSQETPIPIAKDYHQPQTLGSDRLVAAVAADHFYPQKPKLVIDMGTCITLDFVDATGCFQGGAISPGISARFRSLNEATANLPLFNSREKSDVLGKSTQSSILSGVLNGVQFEIQGFIDHYMHENNDLVIILTGGDRLSFDNRLKNSIFAHSNLVLDGLNIILEFNANKSL